MKYYLTIVRNYNGAYTYQLCEGNKYLGSILVSCCDRDEARNKVRNRRKRFVAGGGAGNILFRTYEFK